MKQSMYYFHVYILLCKDASFYVGHTDNLEQRLADHHAGTFSGYTSTRLPVKLIWFDQFSSRDEAFEAEHQIKNWSRKKKLALINGEWDLLKNCAKKSLINLCILKFSLITCCFKFIIKPYKKKLIHRSSRVICVAKRSKSYRGTANKKNRLFCKLLTKFRRVGFVCRPSILIATRFTRDERYEKYF